MKKILLLLCLSIISLNTVCFAAAPKPNQKVFLFYKVPDTVIQCQNANEDMIAGAKELEKELVNHYSKRFIVQGIQRVPQEITLSVADYFTKVQSGQRPFIVEISLEGQGESRTLYQNAFGAQKVGVAPATNIHLVEIIPDSADNAFYEYDYGVQSYSAGTFAIGGSIYAAQKDPRKNTKNAIRGSFRDACEYNKAINKYANPTAYEEEYNRFTGNFKPLSIAKKIVISDQNIRIDNFKEWCNADDSRKIYLAAFGTFNDINFKIEFINNLIKMGVYKE